MLDVGIIEPLEESKWIMHIGIVARIYPCYKGRNGSLMPIGHKGRFLLWMNAEKQN